MFLCLVFVLLSLIQCDDPDDPQYLPNVDLFSQGYNLFKGNPRTDGNDPGLTNRVFDFSAVHLSDDQRWWVPDAFSVVETVDWCKFTSYSHTVEDIYQYYSDLETSVYVHGHVGWSFFGASFSASEDFISVTEILYNESMKLAISTAHCGAYHPKLAYEFVPLNFSVPFIDAVNAISADPTNVPLLYSFLDLFGTHYISEGDAGSRYSRMSYFKSTNYYKMKKLRVDIAESANADFFVYSAGVSKSSTYIQREAHEYDTNRSYVTNVFVGCDAFLKNHSIPDWVVCSRSSPYIVSSSLRPITELINPINFPKIPNHNEVVQAINGSFLNYCAQLPHCKNVKSEPSSCADLKGLGVNQDGEYTIFYQGNSQWPFQIYCIGMEGTLPPSDYVMLPTSADPNFAFYPNENSAGKCAGVGKVVHQAVPIDPHSLEIRAGDSKMANMTTAGDFVDFGAVGCMCFGCKKTRTMLPCCSSTVYTLQGTPFGFSDATSPGVTPPNIAYLDTYHQVVKVTPTLYGGCVKKGALAEERIAFLMYVGQVSEPAISPSCSTAWTFRCGG